MKTVYTVRKVEWADEQIAKGLTAIHNAPRPLYGAATDDTWASPFIHGRHYAALDPTSADYPKHCRLNERMDAVELCFVTEDEAVEKGIVFYKVAYAGTRALERFDFAKPSNRDSLLKKGLDVMNGDETLDD